MPAYPLCADNLPLDTIIVFSITNSSTLRWYGKCSVSKMLGRMHGQLIPFGHFW